MNRQNVLILVTCTHKTEEILPDCKSNNAKLLQHLVSEDSILRPKDSTSNNQLHDVSDKYFRDEELNPLKELKKTVE